MTAFFRFGVRSVGLLALVIGGAACNRVQVLGETPASMGGGGSFVSGGARADQRHMLKHCPNGYDVVDNESVWSDRKHREELHITFSCQQPYSVSRRAPQQTAPVEPPVVEAPAEPAAATPPDSRYWVEPVTPQP